MLQQLNNNMQHTNDFVKENLEYNYLDEIESLQQQTQVIEGYFPKELSEREMYIRKINTTLCVILGIFIVVSMFSYYFVSVNEMKMNKMSKQIVALNDENSELQYKLDKLKSFNNVDMTMQKNKTLTRAKQVLEVPEVNSVNVVDKKINNDKLFSYSIGY